MHIPEFLRDRRFLIAAGVTAAVGVGAWALTRKTAEAPMTSLASEPTPIFTPASAPDGSSTREVDGQSWQCLPMNNPAYPSTFDASKPIVVYPLEAMNKMHDTTPPFLIIRGSDGPIKVFQTFSQEFRRMANGALTCVDGE